MSWLTAIRQDLDAAQERDPAARGTLEVLLTYPGVHALTVHRLSHQIAQLGVAAVAAPDLAPQSLPHRDRDPPRRRRSGRAASSDHGMGVVIGETAIIGEDCHLYQGVTLGGTSTRREKRHPTLEDRVVVGAGAKIIGDVTIGHDSRIGAGAVVVSSVPPNATVIGVPGHVVAFTNTSNDTVERLPDPEWDRIEELERRIARLERDRGEVRAPASSGPGAGGGSPGGFDGGTTGEPQP